MLENREDPGTEGAVLAGVEEEEEAEEQEGEESGPAETLWLTGVFFRPWRITTNVSNPRAAFTTSCGVKGKNYRKSKGFYKAHYNQAQLTKWLISHNVLNHSKKQSNKTLIALYKAESI